jgi:hypothetical protein
MTVARIGARREAASRPSVADLASEVAAALRVRLKESPLLTFAAAGGVGYVLGGGVTVGVLARLLRAGLSTALTIRAEQALTDWLTIGGRPEIPREASSRGTGDSK